MAKTIKVAELPSASDPTQFDVFGQDRTTGKSAKSQMSRLVGPTGPAPNITVKMMALPYGSAPTVGKSGSDNAPTFTIGFPLAKDGSAPMFRNSGTYIQYRYADTEQWQNLVQLSTLKGDKGDKMTFADLTDAEIALLQKPASDAAANANTQADYAREQGDAAQTASGNANTQADYAKEQGDAAKQAAENVRDGEDGRDGTDGKTPIFGTASASSVEPSAAPTATITQTGVDAGGNPVYTVAFGIPKGVKGDKGEGLDYSTMTPEEIAAITGKSAYDVAVENGFEGTEAEWLASLEGPDGNTGPSGVYYGEEEPDDGFDVWIDPSGSADPAPGGGSGDYELTKQKVEAVLTGDISSHNHSTQVAALIQQAVDLINSRIDTLVGGSASSAIDTFREIETFLQGITDVQTLTGLLNGLKEQVVALIPQNAVLDAGYVHTDNNYTTTEKNKLAGIAANANNYTLPTASTTVTGGVRIGAGLKVTDGVADLEKITWVGTQAQYDALPASQKTTDYICFITG